MIKALFALLVGSFFLAGCATVSTSADPFQQSAEEIHVNRVDWDGPRNRLQIVQFDIPEETLNSYPELAEKRVGWGICSRLIDAMYETGRFEFVEEKDDMIERIMGNWAMSQSGAVDESTQIEAGGLRAPEYLVYAEVFDFSVDTEETLVTVAARQNRITRIAIQVRMVDVETGEFVPSSGTGEVEVSQSAVVFSPDRESFHQSTVGQATQMAVNRAVNRLMARID